MRKLILIDGNSLLHRAYHAFPPLTTAKGELINAVYGFSSMLLTILEKLGPTHVAVAWDVKGPTFRKAEFAEYKANRGPMDDDLATQIERTKEVVSVLNIPQFGIEGYEGDDVIGTLARQATDEKKEKDTQVVIVTADRDALQLIKEKKIVVYLPLQNRAAQAVVFDEEKVVETYGFKPKCIVDLKSLMGDSSDNIPGVKGIGKVTATKLIMDFGSLENIFKNIDSDKISKRTREMLLAEREMANQSYKLAEIYKEVPLKIDWEDCLLTNYDKNKATELFKELSFNSLLSRLPKDSWEKETEEIFL
ncbi:MAG TPA: 5'-3' exonuclease H3TH domain-containing protein [Spirochaetia bacterium]|nr:5'-3' exonuclease H3TH domain-containing protein [Spirochaetia bacterium]